MKNNVLTDKSRSLKALDRANLFLTDVRDGVGPYLAIYLVAGHQWDAASIGIPRILLWRERNKG
ncbi:MAG: hypothetical protein H7X92_13115 [Chitinophagales bacterium]|nr:hypothetical protein [Hyphomicrobiales bacterium]